MSELKKIKKINNAFYEKMLETTRRNKNYKPLGRFYFKEENYYIAVDNSTGEMWVEEFLDLKKCLDYLNYKCLT